MTGNEAIAAIPERVQEMLQLGTVIEIGKSGSSQYDFNHDILYVAKGAEKEDIIHEIGHMVENRMMDKVKIQSLIDEMIGEVDITQIQTEIFYTADRVPREIYFIENPAFISQY